MAAQGGLDLIARGWVRVGVRLFGFRLFDALPPSDNLVSVTNVTPIS
jgi:hypothetical protein